MNKMKILRVILFVVLFIAFCDLFWAEALGLNLTLFTLLAAGTLLTFSPRILKSATGLTVLSGTILSALLVWFVGSDAARFASIASLVVLTGLAMVPEIKTIPASLGQGLMNYLLLPLTIIQAREKREKVADKKYRGSLAYLRVSAIPIIAAVIFFLLYRIANPKFDAYSNSFFASLADGWMGLFGEISLPKVLFYVLGLVIAGGILLRVPLDDFLKWESKSTLKMHRRRKMHRRFGMVDLNKELRAGILLLVLVNLLAAMVNVIDISWIWFGFRPDPDFDMSQFVHEGTYVLIFSILLSMAILFWFFRGNLNFYKMNPLLKKLALLWVVQNTLLALSVAIRNFHFMHYHGLAYLRIGVYFFLILTFFGLAMLFVKILRKKTFFFMFTRTAMAAYAMMIGLAVINWDGVIARHNIRHVQDKEIETGFLLSLSPKVLPLLIEQRDVFNTEHTYHYHYPQMGFLVETDYLDKSCQKFVADYESKSWRSWTAPDRRAYPAVKKYVESLKSTQNEKL